MIEKIIDESAKLEGLSKIDVLKFLINNNGKINEEVYNYFKQMILSQIHFDENASTLFDYYLGKKPVGNNILIQNQEIKYLNESDWFNYGNKAFFTMLNDIKNGNYKLLNDFLEFIKNNYDEEFSYSKEDEEYFLKVGNNVKYEGFKIIEDDVKKYVDVLYKNVKIYRELENYEKAKNELVNSLAEEQKKLTEIRKNKGLPVIRNIKLKILKDQKLLDLKKEEKIVLNNIEGIKEKLNNLENNNNYNVLHKPDIETVKEEMIAKFKDLKILCNSTYYRHKVDELIFFVQNEKELEKNLHNIIPRVHDVIQNIHHGVEFKNICEDFLDELQGQFKFTLSMYDKKNIEANDLVTLITNLRGNMKDSNLSANNGISLEYRNKSLGKSDYIKGTNYSYEEINEAMNKLNNEYLKIKDCDNVLEYVRGCADIFQKFLMIHPYSDGNGRTGRALLTVLLAKKKIFIPGIYDSYIERDSNSMFMVFGDAAALNNNYRLFEDYILARVQKYNPELIKGDFSYLKEAYQQILNGNEINNEEDVMKL